MKGPSFEDDRVIVPAEEDTPLGDLRTISHAFERRRENPNRLVGVPTLGTCVRLTQWALARISSRTI